MASPANKKTKKRPTPAERRRRRQRRLALLLLAGLLGVAGWNHQRNLAAERAELRPYRSLSDADLATLLAAAESEARRDVGHQATVAEARREQTRRATEGSGAWRVVRRALDFAP